MSNNVPTIPHVILFEHHNFQGRHKHIFQNEPNLKSDSSNSFDKLMSSIVVLEGSWDFFKEPNFKNGTGLTATPGLYPLASELEIMEKGVSSLRLHAEDLL
jgi:hypothetical protein